MRARARRAPVSAEEASSFFTRAYGHVPTVLASAPGRVNLIGEHTDYNGGMVLPIAIDMRTYVAIALTSGSMAHVVSATEPERGSFAVDHPESAGRWWDYVAGVVRQLSNASGIDMPAFKFAVWSSVPAGAGLSSSAALEVATARAVLGLCKIDLDETRIALLCQDAEQDFVGVGCGIMDQYTAVCARQNHALCLDCYTLDSLHVPVRDAVLIFDTVSPRSLRNSQFNKRRQECADALELLRVLHPGLRSLAAASAHEVAEAQLPKILERRARHVISEHQRVLRAVEALRETGHIPADLIFASHLSLRDDYECSTSELDWFVDAVIEVENIHGARLTGAGWGGCAIALGDNDVLASAAPRIVGGFERRFGRKPRYWISTASHAACIEDVA
ncbi:MAG: galactokinase [Gemmatimonadaceae bacterium]